MVGETVTLNSANGGLMKPRQWATVGEEVRDCKMRRRRRCDRKKMKTKTKTLLYYILKPNEGTQQTRQRREILNLAFTRTPNITLTY